MKSERQKLQDRADKLWSLCVRTRDRKCQVCGDDGLLDAHHIAPRTYKRTRYLLDNGIALCKHKCHFIEKYQPFIFQASIVEIVGEDFYLSMRAKAKGNGSPYKLTIQDLRTICIHLEGQLKSYQADYGELS